MQFGKFFLFFKLYQFFSSLVMKIIEKNTDSNRFYKKNINTIDSFDTNTFYRRDAPVTGGVGMSKKFI